MPQPRNSAGTLAVAVERPNIFAVPVSQAAGGARDRRPDQVFDAAAACDPTRVALAGHSRTNSDMASGVRTGRLMDVGSIRAVLFIGVAVAIVVALAVSVSPIRHERTNPRSPKVPSQRHRPPAHSQPLRPISRAPRPRPIQRGQARKPAVRPVRRRLENRPRPEAVRAASGPRAFASARVAVPSRPLIAPPGRGSLSACQLRRRPSSCDPGGSGSPRSEVPLRIPPSRRHGGYGGTRRRLPCGSRPGRCGVAARGWWRRAGRRRLLPVRGVHQPARRLHDPDRQRVRRARAGVGRTAVSDRRPACGPRARVRRDRRRRGAAVQADRGVQCDCDRQVWSRRSPSRLS